MGREVSYESEFERWILAHLKGRKDEVSRSVLEAFELRRERLGTAVADAIEGFSARRTVYLRKIVSLFEAWREWESLERIGWEVRDPYEKSRRAWSGQGRAAKGERVALLAPERFEFEEWQRVRESRDWPSDEAVAVAVGSFEVEEVGYGDNPDRFEIVYEVTEAYPL